MNNDNNEFLIDLYYFNQHFVHTELFCCQWIFSEKFLKHQGNDKKLRLRFLTKLKLKKFPHYWQLEYKPNLCLQKKWNVAQIGVDYTSVTSSTKISDNTQVHATV